MEVTQRLHKGYTNGPAHLHRKGQLFYYRRRLPIPFDGQVLLSLRTRNYHRAVYLCGLLDAGFAECMNMNSVSVIDPMNKNSSTSVDLKPILKEYLQDVLDRDLEQHRSTSPIQGVYIKGRAYPEQSRVDADLSFLSSVRSEFLEALNERDTRPVEAEALELMEKHGVPKHQQMELCFGLMQTFIKSLKVSEKRVLGEYEAFEIPFPDAAPATDSTAEQVEVDDFGDQPLLSELLPDYFDHQLTETGWSQQTLKQNTATIERFIELVGDKPIQLYTREHLGEFYAVALKIPAKWGQMPKWRAMTWTNLAIETKGDATIPRLSKRTLERHFHGLGGLFKHYKQLGKYVGDNPANGFTFPSGKGKTATLSFDRQMWEGERVLKLFSSPLWQGCKSENKRYLAGELVVRDDKYWLPLLGLYHGNRLEEFAQLSRSDVKQEGEIYYLDIQDELDGNHLKNKQSSRRVPVHPKLMEWGFMAYVETIAPKPTDRLFPNLTRAGPDNKFGANFSKWFTRYRQNIDVYERGVDYHSFRHGVVTKLYEASVDDAVIIQLAGHEGQGTSKKTYLKELSINLLHEGISKVRWLEVEKIIDVSLR